MMAYLLLTLPMTLCGVRQLRTARDLEAFFRQQQDDYYWKERPMFQYIP